MISSARAGALLMLLGLALQPITVLAAPPAPAGPGSQTEAAVPTVPAGPAARAPAPSSPLAPPARPTVPPGNDPKLKTPPPQPPAGDAEQRARLVVQALREGKPELADPFFFPREPFRQVKGIANPDRYFNVLLRLWHEDLQALRRTLRHPEQLELVSFELGAGRRWMPRGKEANALPYWVAYQSRITVRDGQRTVALPVRVMITWDGLWYVTHLTRMKA